MVTRRELHRRIVALIIELEHESVRVIRIDGRAKAMVVTGSRKEAVRYKLQFDQYIKQKEYSSLTAMVAFSGEVGFSPSDPQAEGLVGEKFTELTMNPGLGGRDMRKAFDTDEYHVMIIAQKFQTGFDQPKLCAMYVDKKLAHILALQGPSQRDKKGQQTSPPVST